MCKVPVNRTSEEKGMCKMSVNSLSDEKDLSDLGMSFAGGCDMIWMDI